MVKNFKRLADGDKLSHGYVFFGPKGVGKRIFALGFANYLEKKEFSFDEDSHKILGDLLFISRGEESSLGIDQVRALKNFLSQRPNQSLRRTAIIDESEFLTSEAENALLKITEEPPTSSLLILIAREPEMLTATLSSRLQKIYFSPVKNSEIENWLVKEFSVNGEKAEELANRSFGIPGLARRLLEDEKLAVLLKEAVKFLKVKDTERGSFIKELVSHEDFKILEFLDAVIMVLAQELRIRQALDEKNFVLWHQILELRRNVSFFPLNPRLQIMNLMTHDR